MQVSFLFVDAGQQCQDRLDGKYQEKRSSKNQAMFLGKVHRAALYTRASVIVPLKAAVERAQLVEWIINDGFRLRGHLVLSQI